MYKQVIIVRKDLEWTKGKLAAHAAHAAVNALQTAEPKILAAWQEEGAKKIVLRVDSLKELNDFYKKAKQEKLPVSLIRDAGKTQLVKGTITAVGIGPAEEKKIDRITGKLKLL